MQGQGQGSPDTPLLHIYNVRAPATRLPDKKIKNSCSNWAIFLDQTKYEFLPLYKEDIKF